jgi:hypothetical protein
VTPVIRPVSQSMLYTSCRRMSSQLARLSARQSSASTRSSTTFHASRWSTRTRQPCPMKCRQPGCGVKSPPSTRAQARRRPYARARASARAADLSSARRVRRGSRARAGGLFASISRQARPRGGRRPGLAARIVARPSSGMQVASSDRSGPTSRPCTAHWAPAAGLAARVNAPDS